jgi:transcriptional regulator with XRE-family HTH domain
MGELRGMSVQKDFTWSEVGNRVRNWRRAAGLTQSELAAEAGLTQAGVAVVEGGAHDPRLATLQRIAQVLGRSTRELICGDQCKPALKVGRIQWRVRRLVESNHRAAVTVFRKGLETAELMVSSRSWSGRNNGPHSI